MKRMKQITAAALAVVLLGLLSASVTAEAAPSGKEEVIYVMTDAAGQVTDMEAVNIFAGGDIIDFGDYSAVKPMNTTDDIRQNGDRITFTSKADKVYYQGTLKTTVMPWNISIRYFLDGQEYTAREVAGKSGALEIRFSVAKNERCGCNFYDNYALQASFTLDTDRCRNITASGATIANVGSSKQITYTILPGRGINTAIRADVTDFEMDAAAINGVRLHLNIDIDETALTDKVDELVSAIGSVNTGAGDLNGGLGQLYDATGTLAGRTGDLSTAVGDLTAGAGDLALGLKDITAKNEELIAGAYAAYEGLCTASAAALNSQLEANGLEAVTLTPSTYDRVLTDLLQKLDAQAVYDQAYQTALAQVTEQVEAQADQLYWAYIQSNADSIYLSYVSGQADSLYAQVAAQAIYEQLLKSGYTDQQAKAYLETAEGQAMIVQTVANMTDEQKAQILQGAVTQLTDEQKAEILQGAYASLTDAQKKQIRTAYIQQMMSSQEVTSQIAAAVSQADAAAGEVAGLKGQLDSYGAFYQGLLEYTEAVRDAAAGAEKLKLNMDTLYSNVGVLRLSVDGLHDAVRQLYDGSKTLSDGTDRLAGKTSTMRGQITEEIDSLTSSLTGEGTETESFVSAKNTNVDSVQFVIKTAAIEKADSASDDVPVQESLTFWQKLLRLFGLY